MAVKRKVIWTLTARVEFKDTCLYWNNRNGSHTYTNRLRKLISTNLEKISLFPQTGIPTSFEGIRFVIIKDYLLFYLEQGNNIIVVSFWDGRQDPEKLTKRLT